MSDVHIAEARKHFEWLRATKMPQQHDWQVKSNLRAAKVGFEVLDPTGNKSAAEMEAIFGRLVYEGYVRSAQNQFKNMQLSDLPDIFTEAIARDLEKAGAGYEVLDPIGIKTAHEMMDEIKRFEIAGFRRYVRGRFAELKDSNGPDIILELIETYLPKTGSGYEVIDAEGKKTSVEILDEIIRMTQGRISKKTSDYLHVTYKREAEALAAAVKAAAAYPQLAPVSTGALQTVSQAVTARRRMPGSAYALRKRALDNLARKIASRRTASALATDPAPAC